MSRSINTAMLIRRPVAEVFEAFVDPSVTTRFWFSDSTGPLVAGAKVRWHWRWYGVDADIDVLEVVPNKLIRIRWPVNDVPMDVQWTFTPRDDGATFVEVQQSGFDEDLAASLETMLDMAMGHTWVLAGAKAWLEHHIELGLAPDRFPQD